VLVKQYVETKETKGLPCVVNNEQFIRCVWKKDRQWRD
jgi:hypothetical protein